MSQLKIKELKPIFTKYIPEDLEEGFLYISKEFGLAIHLCACGCKGKTVTPIYNNNNNKDWTMTNNGDLITLRPSIGNFSGKKPYHAHYFITNNKIDWL